MTSPFDQSRYQIRFEWGAEGLARVSPVDVVIVVDALETSPEDAAPIASDATLLRGDVPTARDVAAAVLRIQRERGERTSVAVIAAGDSASGHLRFAVEDQLAAGAVIDALGALGLDHTSPEAAATGEAFRGLRGALRHLFTASGSGQQLIAAGRRDDVLAASEPAHPAA